MSPEEERYKGSSLGRCRMGRVEVSVKISVSQFPINCNCVPGVTW